MALHHGFEPIAWGYHQMIPGQQLQRVASQLWFANRALERAWAFRTLASNLMLICRRRVQMR